MSKILTFCVYIPKLPGMTNMIFTPLILTLLLALSLSGCVSEPKVNLNTPEGLYQMGEFYEKQERFEEAIQNFKALSNKFPYSKLATEAELAVAGVYYKKEEYIEAAAAYKTFKELHPRHPRIDFVTFSAAESIRQQLPSTVDRDLAQAPQAIAYYEEVIALYPNSPYVKEAKEKRLKLIQMLADKEIYIADFYYKQEKYISALSRSEQFLINFPQNSRVPHVLLRAARSADKAAVPDKIRQYVGQLVSTYPNSKEAQQAKSEFPNAR
jgi:outer membrane protein assembly factor BamD